MKNSEYSASLQLIVREIIDESLANPKQGHELQMVQSSLDYLQAIEVALESGKCEHLNKLFKREIPIHPKLLPALSDCINAIQHGTQIGRPSTFTPTQEEIIYEEIRLRKRLNDSNITDEIDQVAFDIDSNESTVRRIWNRQKKADKE
jgi:hypothetical protein